MLIPMSGSGFPRRSFPPGRKSPQMTEVLPLLHLHGMSTSGFGLALEQAERRIHLRTTNPIESTFATVRLRTRVTKGPGSRAAGMPWPTRSSTVADCFGANRFQ
jgi:hypothetical protein